MVEIKRLFQVLLAACLVFVSTEQTVFAGRQEVESALIKSTQPAFHLSSRQKIEGIPDNYLFLAENPDFELYADELTLAFKVVDKRSG